MSDTAPDGSAADPSSRSAGETQDLVTTALRMRASDGDRDKVASVLREAYAEGRLTPVEHEERLAEVYRSQTYADLVTTLRDLPVPAGTLAVPGFSTGLTVSAAGPVPAGLAVRADLADGATTSPAVAVFGSFARKGEWVVPAALNATCIFGGGELDLTQAHLTAAETTITVVCLFGGLSISVPDGVAIRGEVVGIFGGSNIPPVPGAPGDPLLIVKGAAIFGGVEVKRPGTRRRT